MTNSLCDASRSNTRLGLLMKLVHSRSASWMSQGCTAAQPGHEAISRMVFLASNRACERCLNATVLADLPLQKSRLPGTGRRIRVECLLPLVLLGCPLNFLELFFQASILLLASLQVQGQLRDILSILLLILHHPSHENGEMRGLVIVNVTVHLSASHHGSAPNVLKWARDDDVGVGCTACFVN